MEVRISVVDAESSAELESLIDWLRGEPELAGCVRLATPQPGPGELGALMDALIVAVGGGGSISVLISSLNSWLARPRRSDVKIRVLGENGNRAVEIEANRVDGKTIEAVLRRALAVES